MRGSPAYFELSRLDDASRACEEIRRFLPETLQLPVERRPLILVTRVITFFWRSWALVSCRTAIVEPEN
jgi:hypothetical protein